MVVGFISTYANSAILAKVVILNSTHDEDYSVQQLNLMQGSKLMIVH